MAWNAVIGILYYCLLPFGIVLRFLLSLLAPVLHLVHYVLSALFLPTRFLGKFETIYIYLGVAAVIGLLAGFLLHITSSILTSLFNLNSPSKKTQRTTDSMNVPRKQKNLENSWSGVGDSTYQDTMRIDDSVQNKYVDWLEKDTRRHRDQGLLTQIILEEEDDSEY
ncbi:hypothetical protein F5884DRAFT_768739 [Xylogone sp. PMI_703]|nr:hypothetical protein F5884DRAFT_768739 [Xylogone sp. PMI_703]